MAGVHSSPRPPVVSVIIAAYNSSGRLKCAVQSALDQDHSNLEVIVVGDACTDDSAEVLKSIGDDRIRWENLSTNWGEQSIPSNRGVDLASGQFIFFLNQDDLWQRHHVRSCLSLLQESGADMVWSPCLVVPPGYKPGSRTEPIPDLSSYSGSHPKFSPYCFIPASCTAWRSEALRSLNGWRSAAQVFVSPSQDLLWRASRAGMVQVGAAEPSVVVLWSGERPGSYLPEYKATDNEAWLSAIRSNPEVVDDEMAQALKTSQARGPQRRTLRSVVRHIISRPIKYACEIVGHHPASASIAFRHRKSGGFINDVRSLNGLAPVDFRTEDATRASS